MQIAENIMSIRLLFLHIIIVHQCANITSLSIPYCATQFWLYSLKSRGKSVFTKTCTADMLKIIIYTFAPFFAQTAFAGVWVPLIDKNLSSKSTNSWAIFLRFEHSDKTFVRFAVFDYFVYKKRRRCVDAMLTFNCQRCLILQSRQSLQQ